MQWLFGFSVSVIALAVLPGAGLQRFEAVEPHMGTLVRVTVYTADEAAAAAAFRAAFDRIRELDRVLSDYRPDSELNEITRTAVARDVPVSRDLFTVLDAAQDLARATEGAFDVTQGPVVRLWRDARKTRRVPQASALEDAAARSGFRRLHLDRERRTVRLDVPGMALDVGAIGKGYAASEAIAGLRAAGITRALIAISGDLALGDAPPGQRVWRVAIHSHVLELTNAAVSTSGSSEQHVEIDGRRYSHVIDPASRMGLGDDLTVTVVAPHGLHADGLDTAISVLGVERGLRLIESRQGAAALIVQRGPGGTTATPSSRFAELLRR